MHTCGGPGSDGLVSSAWGQQMEQVMCWVRLIFQDVTHSPQAAGGTDSVDLWEVHPNYFPRCPHHPLECTLACLVQLENHTRVHRSARSQ